VVQLPIGREDGFTGVVDLLRLRAPAWPRRRRSARTARAKIADLAAGLPNVSECHRITGEDCFLIKLHAATIESLTETLDKILLCGQTVTSIVHSSPVPPRALPVPD
jgi:Lrp/AsnC family leucine-responsive transcriptional regulator